MSITLIICTYNRARLLRLTLESLTKINILDLDYEIIVVDNNSTDETKLICELFMKEWANIKLKYHFEKKQGLSYARNSGIKISKGDIITFIDDDVILEPDFLIEIRDSFKKYPDANIIGGKVELYYEICKPIWLSEDLEIYLSKLDYGNEVIEIDFETRWLVGANISFKRQVFDSIMFNPKLGRIGANLISGEEIELSKIVLGKGGKAIYCPSIELKHIIPGNRISKEFFKKRVYSGGISTVISEQTTFSFAKFVLSLVRVLKYLIISIVCVFSRNSFINKLHLLENFGRLKGQVLLLK